MTHLLIMELPGGDDTDLLQAALERGDDFTFVTSDLSYYRRSPEVWALLARAASHIEVDPFGYAQLEERVLAANARRKIGGVLCLVDIRIRDAARLAERLGLPHLNSQTATLLRDKYRVRCRMAAHAIAQPEFALADSNEALVAAVDRLGLPIIIKPTDGYGSHNILSLRHPVDLDPLLAPLDELLPTRANYGLGVGASERLIVERLMAGTVIGCDTLTWAGRHVLLGVHEKLFFEPPSFAIRGGCFTPNEPRFAPIERYVSAALDAVGFDWGAAHTEIMLTAQGPRLIEINPRLVGAKIARLVSLALGRSLHADLIGLHAGEAPITLPRRLGRVAVSRWIAAPEAGVLDTVETAEPFHPSVRCVEMVKRSGACVRPPLENADRLGVVMVCGPTAAQAAHWADDFVSKCRCRLQARLQSPLPAVNTRFA